MYKVLQEQLEAHQLDEYHICRTLQTMHDSTVLRYRLKGMGE